MDYKYIEQLMERYWNAETTLEEERVLRAFFSQQDIPADMEPWRGLFADDACGQTLGDDFDDRIMQMIGEEQGAKQAALDTPATTTRRVSITERLMPLFRAAAVVAIIISVGGALQAPWDNSWNSPDDYAALQQNVDTVAAVQPIRAENISDVAVDSAHVLMPEQAKN
jgi:isocitrate dehydrogenase